MPGKDFPPALGAKAGKGLKEEANTDAKRGQSMRARPVFCTKKQFCKLSLIAQRCWQHVSAVENQERLRSC